MGYILTDRELEMDLKLLDSNGDGVIGFEEYNRFESLQLGEENLQLLTEISAHFRKFDRDGSGRVDVTEFKHMYADLVKMKLTNKSMLTTLQELDTDRDGKVNFNEYVVWLLKQNNTGGK
nr:Calcium-dependent secretion activator 2 [Polyrhizophydium stewartii]